MTEVASAWSAPEPVLVVGTDHRGRSGCLWLAVRPRPNDGFLRISFFERGKAPLLARPPGREQIFAPSRRLPPNSDDHPLPVRVFFTGERSLLRRDFEQPGGAGRAGKRPNGVEGRHSAHAGRTIYAFTGATAAVTETKHPNTRPRSKKDTNTAKVPVSQEDF